MFTEQCSGNPTTVDQIGVVATVSILALALGALLLLLTILVFIFKQRMTRRRAANVIKGDENETYGDYSDPDYRMEVEDTNVYYSSDYEAGTGTSRATDNNPYYE